jgi:predicted small secreted protein
MKIPCTRLVLLLLASGIVVLAGTSCNTTRGLGRDVKKVGGHIERAAN